MNTRTRLLYRLADGDWHAGPELAREVGVSRAAVGKAMNALEAMGLPVERERRGYRIPPGARPPRADAIVHALPGAAQRRLLSLQTVYRTDSTNSWLLRRRMAGEQAGSHVCIAAHQTAGRGRLGRSWDSPAGAGLYLSLSLGSAGAPAPAMPLAVASLVAEGIEALIPHAGIQLKWPNDLLLNGSKLGGILMESRGEYGGRWQLVVGIGLNLAAPADDGRTSLSAEGFEPPTAAATAISLLERLLPGLPEAASDPRPWLASWRQRDYYRGADVRVLGPDGTSEGRAAGIDDDGALCLETAVGTRRITGGDVSLREV